jgi:hypothetical protein
LLEFELNYEFVEKNLHSFSVIFRDK